MSVKITIDTLEKALQIAKEQNMIVLRIDLTRRSHIQLCEEAYQDITHIEHIPIRITIKAARKPTIFSRGMNGVHLYK